MQKIASFTVDHNLLDPGIYVSRRDGDITTYDLRTSKPNCGDYMYNLTMHSVEHLFATFVRNSEIKDSVIYFGPMGCQTGFYLLTKDVPDEKVLEITMQILEQIVSYDGEMPGNTAVECGNFRNLNTDAARLECRRYLDVLRNKTNDFRYREA
ncbi:MAG: S-ribosylhomocysteine lyase [Clostridia bacterium]|nr:S-ribosylhomocysteine lyase [Clostridia bacterium]